MWNRSLLATTLLTCALAGPGPNAARTTPAADDPVADPLAPFETTTLHSEVLDEDRRVTVYVPPGHGSDGPPLPVLCLPATDGTYLHFASGTARILEAFGNVPPMIVVGLRDVQGQRDLTPTSYASGGPECGGGEAFLEHIRSEVIPFVEAHYPAGPRRFIWGHSIVGTFALYAFLSDPDTFEGVIASSPWLIYDGEERFMLTSTPAWLAKRQEHPGAMFFSVGEEPRWGGASRGHRARPGWTESRTSARASRASSDDGRVRREPQSPAPIQVLAAQYAMAMRARAKSTGNQRTKADGTC